MTTEAITAMMESLKKIQEDNEEFKASNAEIKERLIKLEEEKTVKVETVKVETADQAGGSRSGTTQVVVQGSAKEKSLSLTFGEDESPMSLKLFVEHYTLAKSQNIRKKVDGWQEADFRANELRFQLRGRVAAWVLQESAMHSEWVKDDVEIIRKLQERYLGTMSVELNIISFEELRQRDSESLAEYMTRCQEKGYQAFSDFAPNGVQQRIVWKFLSGIRDADVRSEVIKAKWMVSGSESKPFAEVLKIAETAKLAKIATMATGGGRGQESGKIASAPRIEERRNAHGPYNSRGGNNHRGRVPHSSDESGGSRGSRSSTGSAKSRSSTDSDTPGQNFLCHYCKERSHYGGWKNCEKRRKENPDWKPGF
jgi:hypothetical protein